MPPSPGRGFLKALCALNLVNGLVEVLALGELALPSLCEVGHPSRSGPAESESEDLGVTRWGPPVAGPL